jgi:hypothetical protein
MHGQRECDREENDDSQDEEQSLHVTCLRWEGDSSAVWSAVPDGR